MANHCECELKITGLSDLESKELLEAIQVKGLLEACVPEPEWSETPNLQGELPSGQDERGILRWKNGEPDGRWYEWRYKNWGTKWAEIEDEGMQSEPGCITCKFYSAWEPPIEAVVTLSERYPSCAFILRYYESGVMFAGVLAALGGKQKDIRINPGFEISITREAKDCPGLDGHDCDEELSDDEWEQIDRAQRESVASRLNEIEAGLCEDIRRGRLENRKQPYAEPMKAAGVETETGVFELITSWFGGESRKRSDTPNPKLVRK